MTTDEPLGRSADGSDNQPLNAEGAWAQQAEADLGDRRLREEIERGLSFGLEAAPTINDRTISTFVRGEKPHFAGERGTFLKCPFIEDVNQVLGHLSRVVSSKDKELAVEQVSLRELRSRLQRKPLASITVSKN